MATVYAPDDALQSERRFFFVMACVLAAIIAGGFGLQLARGRSTFAVPLVYHIHAVVFMSWTALFVTQATLALRGEIARHRALGRLGAALLPAMGVLGTAMTVVSLRRHGGPFFFAENEFLFLNVTGLWSAIVMFGFGMVLAARGEIARHRRVMLTTMAVLATPGMGRLLPMPLFIPYGWWAIQATMMIVPAIGLVRDWRRDGRHHPDWLRTAAILLGAQLAAALVAFSPPGLALTHAVIDGTPGAARPMAAYLP